MGPIGWPEMVVIFVVALMLFGPKELPKIGKTVAKAINDFKRASNELKDTWQRELSELERETQDIRTEITRETDQISQTTSSYGESYYNHDSSYDYGAYGYPSTTTDSTVSGTEPASADAAQITSGEGVQTSDGSAGMTGPVEAPAPAASDAAPVVAAAHGTVPTHPLPPAAESTTHDDASSL
jgi:sec-independent protein translocase protein TatA